MKLGRRVTEACNSVVWFERPGRKLQALEMNCKDFFCFQNCYSDNLSWSTQDQLKVSVVMQNSQLRETGLVKLVIAPNWPGGDNWTQRSVDSSYVPRSHLNPVLSACCHSLQPRDCDRDAIRIMGIGFDVLKLAILIWFLAPFGYNASDVLFENVNYLYF